MRSDDAQRRAPAEVLRLVQEWRAHGEPAQPGIPWPRERWVDAFSHHTPIFERLPDDLDRDAVRSAVNRALSQHDVLGAFLPCMAWGYGRVGYGPFRVLRMLEEDGAANAEAKLAVVARAAADGRPVDAFELLAGASRIEGLGPAFGTKFIFFVHRGGLILDRVIAAGLLRVGSLRFNPTRWDPAAYARYLETMRRWASELNLQSDELEQVLFTAESRRAGSQWGTED